MNPVPSRATCATPTREVGSQKVSTSRIPSGHATSRAAQGTHRSRSPQNSTQETGRGRWQMQDFVVRVGLRLSFKTPELLQIADALDDYGFKVVASLKDLSEPIAVHLNIPSQLAAELRHETTERTSSVKIYYKGQNDDSKQNEVTNTELSNDGSQRADAHQVPETPPSPEIAGRCRLPATSRRVGQGQARHNARSPSAHEETKPEIAHCKSLTRPPRNPVSRSRLAGSPEGTDSAKMSKEFEVEVPSVIGVDLEGRTRPSAERGPRTLRSSGTGHKTYEGSSSAKEVPSSPRLPPRSRHGDGLPVLGSPGVLHRTKSPSKVEEGSQKTKAIPKSRLRSNRSPASPRNRTAERGPPGSTPEETLQPSMSRECDAVCDVEGCNKPAFNELNGRPLCCPCLLRTAAALFVDPDSVET